MGYNIKYFLLCIIFSAMIPLSLFSRDVSIEILDKDLEMPLEGVKIYVKNIEKIIYTDFNGKAIVSINDSDERLLLTTSLIGYESRRLNIKNLDEPVIIEMSLSGIIEGKELVVEEEAIGKTDEEVGVSTVIDDNEIKATAEVGVLEDIISSVKVLPGVTYTGSFDSRLAVRGGHPSEFTTMLDGFIIRNPYHWGRAFSIFNPNIIDSAKFSNGIFSVKHGFAMSGLLEMDTIQPDNGVKFETKLSTQTVEAFLQMPVGLPDAGFYAGFRITFLDFPIWIVELLKDNSLIPEDGNTFDQPAYIRDGYLKWFWKPHERVEWHANAFFYSDGVGITYKEPNADEDKEIVSLFDFEWSNINALAFTKFKFLPTDFIFIYFLLGYEFHYEYMDAVSDNYGVQPYTADFIDKYQSLVSKDYFRIDSAKTAFNRYEFYHSIQSRLDFDFQLHEKVTLSTGLGVLTDFFTNQSQGSTFILFEYNLGGPINNAYRSIDIGSDEKQKYYVKSFIYLSAEFNILPEILKLELGARMDHFYLAVESDKRASGIYDINTIPAPGPRLNLTWTPVKGHKVVENFTISTGAGLFSKVPFEEQNFSDEFGIGNFELPMPEAFYTVGGFEFEFPYGFKFKLEGYYKYYFNRMYVIEDISQSNVSDRYDVYWDGIGHVAGFDMMFQRKESRYIDGWISYSFVFAQYYNPGPANYDDSSEYLTGPLIDTWYYPSFHRFHTLNIVLNVKPLSWFTITAQFTFASGAPLKVFGDVETYPALYYESGQNTPNGEILQMFERSSVYSNELRTNFSFPLNLKFSFHYFFPKRKVRYESYIGFDDVFSFISYYYQSDNITTDPFSGNDQPSPQANVNLPFPIPSFGITINF